MAAGLGLVNLVLNYENQDCSTVLTFSHFYVTKAVRVDTVWLWIRSYTQCKMNLLLLELEKYSLQSQSWFLALVISAYIRERWLLWGETKSFCLSLGNDTAFQPVTQSRANASHWLQAGSCSPDPPRLSVSLALGWSPENTAAAAASISFLQRALPRTWVPVGLGAQGELRAVLRGTRELRAVLLCCAFAQAGLGSSHPSSGEAFPAAGACQSWSAAWFQCKGVWLLPEWRISH